MLSWMGKSEDIARAIIFFASIQADWITGQVFYVGSGNSKQRDQTYTTFGKDARLTGGV